MYKANKANEYFTDCLSKPFSASNLQQVSSNLMFLRIFVTITPLTQLQQLE